MALEAIAEVQKYFLGIDGGGSKTTAVILNADGVELGRGTGGPGNIATMSDTLLRQSLVDAIYAARLSSQIQESFSYGSVCAGMAGYSAEGRRSEFLELLRDVTSAERCLLEPDYRIAYWGATHGEPGIVVIAGTGAVAFGRNQAGQMDREDGLGFLLGDKGSGFDLGLNALRHAVHMNRDGRTDAITQAVMAHTNTNSCEQIVQWLYGQFSPARVASVAPLVGKLADSNDPAACWYVVQMAKCLRHSVRALQQRLLFAEPCPIYPLGGLWNIGRFFREEFRKPGWHGTPEYMVAATPESDEAYEVATPRSDAAYGAGLYARMHC